MFKDILIRSKKKAHRCTCRKCLLNVRFRKVKNYTNKLFFEYHFQLILSSNITFFLHVVKSTIRAFTSVSILLFYVSISRRV
jgi:hypothetical protein